MVGGAVRYAQRHRVASGRRGRSEQHAGSEGRHGLVLALLLLGAFAFSPEISAGLGFRQMAAGYSPQH
jgi:hypothetical protein